MEKTNNLFLDITKRITIILHKIEEYILVFLLGIIIIFSFSQILLRNFLRIVEWFSRTFHLGDSLRFLLHAKPTVWADPLIRYSVLWLGLIAAGITTLENKHINVDVIGRFAKGRLRSTVLALTNLFASTVTFIMCYISIIYIKNIEFPGSASSPILNIPNWVLLLILPFSFGIISLRFFIHFIQKVYSFVYKCEDKIDIKEEKIIEIKKKSKTKKKTLRTKK